MRSTIMAAAADALTIRDPIGATPSAMTLPGQAAPAPATPPAEEAEP